MKIDEFTEKLFLAAILRCGVDIASKVISAYIEVRADEEVINWIKETIDGNT
uniref:Uncharacterized protein n=1 Tax=viral metagenome TaxID=1070528 RepID=A0A6M3Y421_9ZZZZ